MSRIINLSDGMRFGAGVDTHTEEVRGLPIVYDKETYGLGGQKVNAQVKIIESQESLMKSMNLSISAGVRYGLASADARFSMVQDSSVNQYALYVLLSTSVRNPPRYMVNPRLSDQAKQMYRNDPETFRSTYGETFIDEIYSGGDFYGLFIFNTYDERSRTELKASLDVSIGGFLAGGNISMAFESAIEESKSRSSMEIRAIMSGGSGLQNPSTLEELKQLYRNFNAEVQRNPVDFQASIKDFRYLPLPQGPTFAEQAVRRDTIDNSARRIVEGIKLRGDIEFVLKFPEQFENPDLPALKAAYAAIDEQLPKLAKRARDCAQDIGQCSLGGLEPITATLPKRLANAGDPLQVKWEDVLAHDSRAAAWVPSGGLRSPLSKYDRGPRGGRYKLFYNNDNKVTGGLFWHPDLGAHVVYGGIMQTYLARGHCEGPLGYPKTDEATLTGSSADGLDRISLFEHGLLWWDAQSGVVSDKSPHLSLVTLAGGLRLNLKDAMQAPSRASMARAALRPMMLPR